MVVPFAVCPVAVAWPAVPRLSAASVAVVGVGRSPGWVVPVHRARRVHAGTQVVVGRDVAGLVLLKKYASKKKRLGVW